MVVVGGDKKIKEVQITAGGLGKYVGGKKIQFADTRLHSDMLISNADKRCEITIGDNSESKKSNTVMKSIASGIDNSMTCLSEDTYYDCEEATGSTNTDCDAAGATASFAACTGADIGACSNKPTSTACADGTDNTGTAKSRSDCPLSECDFVADADKTCLFKGTCGTRTFADTVFGHTYHHVLNTNAAAGTTGEVSGVRHTLQCNDNHEVAKITVTQGGNADTDMALANRADLNVMGSCGDSGGTCADASPTTDDGCVAANCGFTPAAAPKFLVAGRGVTGYSVNKDCTNDYYYQFGFYSSGTPRWNRDLTQNNHHMGKTPKDEQVALYGMKNHMQYQFRRGTATMAQDSFYGKARDTFSDLNTGIGSFDVGYSITDTDNDDDTPQMTASIIAGENGAEADFASGFGEMMEFAEKYAYIGRGYDKLTVTPVPDAMTDEKVTITYTGPSAGCSVTEVDRGTHESSECSGRGNCDYATGTCLCDAGCTLEACSEQTVLV